MVRLMLTLTPVVCVLSGIAFSYTYERYLRDDTTAITTTPTRGGGGGGKPGKASAASTVMSTYSNDSEEAKNLYDKVRARFSKLLKSTMLLFSQGKARNPVMRRLIQAGLLHHPQRLRLTRMVLV